MLEWGDMKKLAILCNASSSSITARAELIEELHKHNVQPYCGRIMDKEVHPYFSEETAICLPIIANRSNLNPIVEIRSMISVKNAIKNNQIDSVIVYGVKNHAAMAVGAKLGGAKRILCVVNGSGNLFRMTGVKGFVARLMAFPMLYFAYKCCCAVCFQNNDDRELFVKKHLVKDEEKCFVTGGSGVNLELYQATPLPKENRFLFLSRITPSKGITEYIKAAQIVKEKHPDAIFDIVGPLDASVEASCGALLQSALDAGIVNYHGATDDVPGWMAKCRFFVYPSYYPEGVPRCAIQAIASGRPIITCDTPGCKETVIDGVNGFMIPSKDENALSEKMIWMIEHPEAVAEMAVASRKLAEQKFNVEEINRQLISRLK